jgi:hypothetical protein
MQHQVRNKQQRNWAAASLPPRMPGGVSESAAGEDDAYQVKRET